MTSDLIEIQRQVHEMYDLMLEHMVRTSFVSEEEFDVARITHPTYSATTSVLKTAWVLES